MAQTTSAINACDAVIKLDNGAGNLADISGSSNSITLNRLTQVSDAFYSFGGRFPIRKACGKDADITLRVVYSGDDAEALYILNDWYENHNTDARSLRVEIPDGDPGGDRYDFEVLLGTLNMDATSGEPNPILVEASLRPTGTFTWSVIGS